MVTAGLQMDEDELIRHIAGVTSSDVWWKPVIGFIVTNCAKFAGLDFTNEEHDCYVSFVRFLTEVFDSFLAKRLNTKAATLESAMLGGLRRGNPTAIAIGQMLRNYTDFIFFRQQMLAMNEEIRQDTVKRVMQCHQRMADANQAEAADLPQLLEEGEKAILESVAAKKCQEFQAIFHVEPGPAPAPLPALRVGKSLNVPQSPPTITPHGSAVRLAKGPIVKPTMAKFGP
jgi:hypothetical protein